MAIKFTSITAASALGNELRAARLAAGYTRAHVAARTSVHVSQISRIERGQMAFVGKNVQELCTFLSVALPTSHMTATDSAMEARLGRLDALLGRAKGDRTSLTHLLDALEAFAEAYASSEAGR